MTAVYTMPANIIKKASRNSYKLTHNFQETQALYQNFVQRSNATDIRWMLEFDMTTLDFTTTQRFQAFYDAVMAKGEYFTIFDPVHEYPRNGCPLPFFEEDLFRGDISFSDNIGIARSAPATVIDTTNFRGNTTLNVQGLIPNRLVMGQGDRFQLIHNCLPYTYELTQDAYSDRAGYSEFFISPGLRDYTETGQEVNFVRPRTTCQFIESTVERGNRFVGNITFQAQEVYELVDVMDIVLR